MPKFQDAKFMSASAEELVLKQWITFIRGGFQWKHFTERLYEHLHQHSSFIAHYNRLGFYQTYFENPEDTARFLSQFDRDKERRSIEFGMNDWISGDYKDLNEALCEATEPYKVSLYEQCSNEARNRDITLAENLLRKHGVLVKDSVGSKLGFREKGNTEDGKPLER